MTRSTNGFSVDRPRAAMLIECCEPATPPEQMRQAAEDEDAASCSFLSQRSELSADYRGATGHLRIGCTHITLVHCLQAA